jgi:putative integral membrane protein (TIGR02587 family)
MQTEAHQKRLGMRGDPVQMNSASRQIQGGDMSGRTNRRYAKDFARAVGGALIFAFPLLMTMEMWFLGFYMDRVRLCLFMIVVLVLLIGLANFTGFEKAESWADNVMDALSAFAAGVLASVAMLVIFGILTLDMQFREIVGKTALQSVPASIGAMLARKQMGEREEPNEENAVEAGYGAQLFLMMVGALFVAFNVAPTEEMILIAYKMTPWHAIALAIASVVLLEVFVYAVGFAGEEDVPQGSACPIRFLHFTIAGYGIALLVSLYVLWSFGRTDGTELAQIAMMTVVLGFPAALGAATARLIV